MPDFVGAAAKSWFTPGHGRGAQAGTRQDQRSGAGRAARRRGRRGSRHRVAGARPDAAGVEGAGAPPQHAPDLGALRRQSRRSCSTCGGRRNCPPQPAPGDDLRARRRMGARQPDPAGLRADVPPGRAWAGCACPSTTGSRRINRWPQHITDVKTAIAWARANVDKFGGDRNFVTIAGTSAGGHLAALAGLTPNDPELQADLPEGSDTSVDAVVGIYGRYDWEDRSTVERARFVDFLERVVVKRKIDQAPRDLPQGLADRPGARRRAAVPGGARHRRHRHPGRSRPATSSSGCAACPGPWSATSSCPAPATAST